MFLGFDAMGFSAIGEPPEDRVALGGTADVSLDWGVRIYAATHEYISRPADEPADTPFLGTLEKAFRFDRSILGSQRIGEEITAGFGEVRLANIEGDYDFLSVDHTPLGQRIIIKMGDRRKAHSTWRTVLDGYSVDQRIDRDSITFRVRDGGHKLDVAVSQNVYAGTGGSEGGDDVKGKCKPRWFGHNLNVTPPLVIPASLAYQLNDGQIEAVDAVYVRGVAMVLDADYASVALMNAASLSVGEYATCLADGWMRIAVAGGTELGQVTCDFQGDKAGGVFVETAADIVERIASPEFGAADLIATAFATLNADQPAPIGYGVPVGDEQTKAQAIGRVMASIGGWAGTKRTGKLGVWRFTVPAGLPSGTYTRANVENVSLATLPSELSPPPWRVRVAYERNQTIQTDLAGSVSDARRAFLKEVVRFAEPAEDLVVRADFPPGHELVEQETLFRDEADAAAEAVRKLALYGSPRALYVVKLSEPLFVHEVGQVISLQFDARFDLDTAKLCRIVKLTEDDAEGVEMTVFG